MLCGHDVFLKDNPEALHVLLFDRWRTKEQKSCENFPLRVVFFLLPPSLKIAEADYLSVYSSHFFWWVFTGFCKFKSGPERLKLWDVY